MVNNYEEIRLDKSLSNEEIQQHQLKERNT